MFTVSARVTWTTDAIATLVHRDRYLQAVALMEFDNLIGGVLQNNYGGRWTKCIDEKEQFYFTVVAGGSYVIFYKYFRGDDVVEVQAVGDTLFSDVSKVYELIRREGLKSLCY